MNPKILFATAALALASLALPAAKAQQLLPISDAPLSTQDVDFVQRANAGHLNLMKLGRAGQGHGTHPGVRELGTNLMHAHTKENDALKLLAGAKHVDLPDRVEASQQYEGEDLAVLPKGGDFDSRYIPSVERDLEDMIALYEGAATSLDPDIRRYVALTLPALRDQLQDARDLTGKPPGGTDDD
jgi:predicted outer membrane protein